MKKRDWKALAREHERALGDAEQRVTQTMAEASRLKAELEATRKNWRPVPMTHPWQPRDPQCALCDEPRDASRHQDGSQWWTQTRPSEAT